VIRLAPLALLLIIVSGCSANGISLRPADLQWWWSNQDPPGVVLSAPGTAVRATTSIQVSLTPADKASVVIASLDELEIPSRTPLVIDTSTLPDGPHTVTVVAEDRSRRRNRAQAAITFLSDNTPPSLSWEIQPTTVTQGSAAILRLRSNEPTAVEALADNNPVPLTLGNGYAWAFLSFSPSATLGERTLNLSGRDEAGNEMRATAHVEVKPGAFPSEDLEVPAALARLLAPEFRADEDAMLARIYAQTSEPARWSGRFRVPADGPIITEFATERAYNHGPSVGNHAGVDIAAPMGSPVQATQNGIVKLIDELSLRGNTLVLDHGHGVYSLYAHLQEILVSPGEQVEAGQRIARVGTTGLSTGPHLHWEIWVGGANVDPFAFTKLDLP
jgi:hypothetical protein